jgi:flagellar motor switch protein FliN
MTDIATNPSAPDTLETDASAAADLGGGTDASAAAGSDISPPATLAEALDGQGLVAEIEAALGTDEAHEEAATVAVTPVPLAELEDGPVASATMADLRFLADIDVQVAVEFGRAQLPLRDLLSLGRGQILELDRRVEELVDVLVNGTLVARGEVVLVEGRYGVRIREILGADAPPPAAASPTTDPASTGPPASPGAAA